MDSRSPLLLLPDGLSDPGDGPGRVDTVHGLGRRLGLS